MDQSLLLDSPPDLWEIEWEIVAIVCEQLALSRNVIKPDSMLFFEIPVDSLDTIELILEIEEHFQVAIPDDDLQLGFTAPPTIHDLAVIVRSRWGTGNPPRSQSMFSKPKLSRSRSAVHLQLGGKISAKEWMEGQLYDPMGSNGEGRPQFRRRTDGMRCVLVPGAEAWIGNPTDEGLIDQRPLHQAEISDFLIDAEPVSNGAFARFLNSIGKLPETILHEWIGPDDDRRRPQFPLNRGWLSWKPVAGAHRQPMMLLSWKGANAYSLWANRRDWRRYRSDGLIPAELKDFRVDAAPPPEKLLHTCLPSEAQWEYAARGAEPKRFPWGDEPDNDERMRTARHALGSDYSAEAIPSANVSDRLGMSPFGLHHMAGNVWQWLRDWYAPDFYEKPASRLRDPQNTEPTGIRSERGGSWVGPSELANSWYRRGRVPAARGRCLGFRCVGLLEDLP